MTALPAYQYYRRQSTWRDGLRRVLWWEPFWIALLAPGLLFPGRFWVTSLQPALVLLLFAFWPLRLLAGGRSLRRTPVDWAAAALVAAVGVAVALSPAPASSWEAAGLLLLGVAGAGALVQWPPVQARPARAAWLLLGICTVVALAGPLLLGSQPDKLGSHWLLREVPREAAALGETVNPNVLGGALVLPVLITLALAIGPRWSGQPWRPVWAVLCLGFGGELLYTQCRGAYLGAAAGVLMLCLLRWPRSGWLLIPLAGVGAALIAFSGGLGILFDSVGASETAGVMGAAGEGLVERVTIWQAAVTALAQQPLTGIGLGLFGPWVDQHGLLAAKINWQPHAHNLLLQVAADLGVLGLAAYAAVWVGAGAMLVSLLRKRPLESRRGHQRRSDRRREMTEPGQEQAPQRIAVAAVHRQRLQWTLAAGCAAAGVGLLVHGVVDAALWGNKMAFLPSMLLAVVCLLFLDAEKR